MPGTCFLPWGSGRKILTRKPISLVRENQRVSCPIKQSKRVLIFAGIRLNRQLGFDLFGLGRAVVQQSAGTALLAYVKLKMIRI